MRHEPPAIAALLSQLKPPAHIDLSLDAMHKALAEAGNPHLALPPVVHVAGTNGKGSTLAFLRAMLEAADYRCHVYTSPHLVHFCERIVVAGKPIDDVRLERYLAQAVALAQRHGLTFFEATTLAAFLAFAYAPADIVLLEVGMGGRLDATNVVAHPALTIITPVSMDHSEYLGNTLAAIAAEKAGILKAGCPALIGPQAPEAQQRIEQVANDIGALLYVAGRAWTYAADSCGLHLRWKEDAEEVYTPDLALTGEHQHINAAVALAAMRLLDRQGFASTPAQRQSGLRHAHWPARLQTITDGPLASLLPAGWQLVLDGGHNEAAAQQLAAWAAQHPHTHLICGMTAHKDAAAFLRILTPHMRSIHLVPIPDEPMAMALETLCEQARAVNVTYASHPGIAQAIDAILHASNEKTGYILICGSLYLAGHVLAARHILP